MSTAETRAALRDDLSRRFRTATRDLEIGGRRVQLLMPANADDLISEDDLVRDERLPYWADVWPSARILADELAVMRLGGQRVLELGCGLGVVAIGATLAGAAVTATDYYDEALEFATLNVAEATGRTIASRMVNWVDLPRDLGRFDVVLASDVLYEHRYASLVANAIAATLVRGPRPHRAARVPRRVRDHRPRARERSATVRRWRDQADSDAVAAEVENAVSWLVG
jgi:predicted nicotinamide N-methyase